MALWVRISTDLIGLVNTTNNSTRITVYDIISDVQNKNVRQRHDNSKLSIYSEALKHILAGLFIDDLTGNN